MSQQLQAKKYTVFSEARPGYASVREYVCGHDWVEERLVPIEWDSGSETYRGTGKVKLERSVDIPAEVMAEIRLALWQLDQVGALTDYEHACAEDTLSVLLDDYPCVFSEVDGVELEKQR